jgi:dTMP kinase
VAPFISIEGIDGSGGTTQTRLLAERLRDNTTPMLVTKAPWPSSAYEPAIRQLLKDRESVGGGLMTWDRTLYELFLLDRADHWEFIRPQLDQGFTVISDRWHYATLVYQSAVGAGFINQIELELVQNLKIPHADLTVVLDMPSGTASSRMASRSRDSFEKDNRIQRMVRRTYTDLETLNDNLVVVSGTGYTSESGQPCQAASPMSDFA